MNNIQHETYPYQIEAPSLHWIMALGRDILSKVHCLITVVDLLIIQYAITWAN